MLPTELPVWTAFSGLVPLLLGGVAAAMRLFVEPVREFRLRASLIEQRLRETISIRLATLLNHARRIDDDSLLRGDGRIEPDLVGELTEVLFRLFRWSHKLELLRWRVRLCFHLLLAVSILGVAGVLVGLLWAASRPIVVYTATGLVAIQTVLVVVNYLLATKLEEYEDVA